MKHHAKNKSAYLAALLTCISTFDALSNAASTDDQSQYVIELPNGEIRPAPFNHALRSWDTEEPIDQINYLSDRIVGGREAKISEVPYQVAVMVRKHGILCGGAIYNEHTIISAAHCFPSAARNYLIVAGKSNLLQKEKHEQLSVAAFIKIHPEFSAQDQINDLAIVKLKTPLCFNGHVQPIQLPKSGHLANGNGIISGWGYTQARESGEKYDKSKYSRILKLTKLDIISKINCTRRYAANAPALLMAEHESTFCAGSKTNDDNCQGDSGGPIVCGEPPEKILCGVVSAGLGCGQPDTPAFYTELANPKLHQWIRENAGEQSYACEASGEEPTNVCPDPDPKPDCPENSGSSQK